MLADNIRKGNETSRHAQLVWCKPDTCAIGSYSEQLLLAHLLCLERPVTCLLL